MPKIKGKIAYFKLEDWWLSAFTPEERDYIESVYRPFGVGEQQEKPLTQGEIFSSSGNALQLLTGLASWLRKPSDRHLAHRILSKIEELVSGASDVEALHFSFQTMGETYYKSRSDPEALSKAIASYEQQVAIAPLVAAAMKRKYPGAAMPSHVGFRQLAIIREQEKDHNAAIQLCKTAVKQGWDGDWLKRIERCTKKLGKQAN